MSSPMKKTAAYLSREYNLRDSVPDFAAEMQAYAECSQFAKHALTDWLTVSYGAHPDETLDIFPAGGGRSPVYLFIHGGFWRALSKDESCFMAPCFAAAGATVVTLNYSLAPGVSVDHIVQQCRQALAWVYREIHRYGGDPGRIHVSGSSAGGHLTGMLLAPGWHDALRVPADIVHSASPISPLADLRPLLSTPVNEWARLDEQAAARLSPILNIPAKGCPLVVAWGEQEPAEMRVQGRNYAQAWQSQGFTVRALQVKQRNHFNILMDLRDCESDLTRAILATMQLL